MKNPKLIGLTNLFATKFNITGDIAHKYELYSNYLMLNKEFYSHNGSYPFDSQIDEDFLEDINFGRNNTMAADGCFVIHKDNIFSISDEESINDIMTSIDKGSVHIVLIQTKSGDLDPNSLSTLSDCLNANFTSQPNWSIFAKLKAACANILSTKPKISIFFKVIYVVGNLIDVNLFSNSTFVVREIALKKAMKDYFWINSDDNISIEYFDENKILAEIERHDNESNLINCLINHYEITKEIDCQGNGKILFGAVSIGELMKVLYNPTTMRPNELYEYNVRDAISDSPINERIKDSLRNNKELFLLLNNGITFIVDKQETRGKSSILLENVRIVNGCQTCHAIMDVVNNTPEYNDTLVAVKIIETNNDSLLGKITYSSNNQNPVKPANLFAIEPQIFALENQYKDFFISYKTIFNEMVLERRQGQFRNTDDKYIDMLSQAKAVIALWHREPHSALMYADAPLTKYKASINSKLFVSCSLFAGILWCAINDRIPANYKNARYHIFACIGLKMLSDKFQIENIIDTDLAGLEGRIANDESIISFLSTFKPGQLFSLTDEIQKVCDSIDSLSDLFPKLSSGKIHYRKFYPTSVLKDIYNVYSLL